MKAKLNPPVGTCPPQFWKNKYFVGNLNYTSSAQGRTTWQVHIQRESSHHKHYKHTTKSIQLMKMSMAMVTRLALEKTMTQLPGNGRWRSSTWRLPLNFKLRLAFLINVLFYSNIPCSCSWLALSWSHFWWCVSGKRLVPNPPFSSLWSDVGRLLMDPQDSLIPGCRSYHEGPASLVKQYKYFLGKYRLDPDIEKGG